ncbi:MAG: flagellar hook-associated protein FlgL [Anaerolineales bacterium]|nr:flagellar hook-associated protein FlgL [Anaerolineales bacterium]
MRITHRMLISNAVENMEASMARLADLNSKYASGKKIQAPSDDPAVAVAGLSARSGIRNCENYIDLANTTGNWLDANDVALGQVIDEVTRALVLSETGVSDTVGEEERTTLSEELNSILNEIIEIGNTQHEGDYLFAGFLTQTRPFELVSGTPDTVSYSGDTGVIQRAVSPGQLITVNIDGDAAFNPVFDAIIRGRDALAANNKTEIGAAITDLQNAIESVKIVRTNNGSRKRQVNNTIDRLTDTKSDMETLLSQKEDINMAEVISDLQYQEVVYQSVLESGKMALNLPTLFSFLG